MIIIYKNKSYLAFIPARGGSKGIYKKNIALLNGEPLIRYTLKAAKKSKYIDYTVASTDDKDIANLCKEGGAEVIMRPDSISGDNAKIIESLIYTIKVIGKSFDNIVLLQPTSPFRLSNHIDESIELFNSKGCRPLASVSPVNDNPLLIRRIDNENALRNLLKCKSTVRRQDMEAYYRVNGAVYINGIDSISPVTSFNDNPIGYIMPQEFSIDIDQQCDLAYAECLLKENEKLRSALCRK